MAIEIVPISTFEQKAVEIGSATATSSDTETTIATIDARGFTFGSITGKNAGAQSVTVNVYGYNDPAYSDEETVGTLVMAKTSTIVSGGADLLYLGHTAVAVAQNFIFAYYKIKLVNATLASGHASATTVYWCLKNT